MRYSLILAVIAVIALAVKVANNAPSVDQIQTVVEKPAAVAVPQAEDRLADEAQRVGGNPEARVEEAIVEPEQPAAPPEAPATATTETATEAPVNQDTCACNACGRECQCADPMICKNGDCERDYAIVFTTAWCGPCKTMHGFIAKLQAEGYRVYYWDVAAFPKAAAFFKIATVPTTFFFDRGTQRQKYVGVIGEGVFRQFLKPRYRLVQ